MKHLAQYIQELYPQDADMVMTELQSILNTLPHFKPHPKDKYWYKLINQYAVYPDALPTEEGSSPLLSLIPHLECIAKLGCNAVHILPFLDSPLVDKGFDIRSFFAVRSDLGTFDDLLYLKQAADKQSLHLFMDLVFNHVSDEHEWFRKAVEGNEHYRNYFFHSQQKPTFLRTYQKNNTVWAEYHVDDTSVHVHIVFPDMVGEIPHWRQAEDGYWYYHTFYPQQLDTNWDNPYVFLEYARILIYWSALGFNFRLDAIPFVGKSAYKQFDSDNRRTHTIIKGLHHISQLINPECVFIVETYEDISSIIHYFGTREVRQTELAYNFHLSVYMWASIMQENAQYMWDKLLQISIIPEHAEWLNFLRNHDQLEFSYTSEWLKQKVVPELLRNGAPFRGENDVAGRTYSLLGKNKKRFLMAYFLLASMPGALAIPYGDEFGLENIPLDSLSVEDQKDTRNINRGKLLPEKTDTPHAQAMFGDMGKIIQRRSILRDFLHVRPEKVYELDHHKEIFSALYRYGDVELLVVVNLSGTEQELSHELHGYALVAHVNKASLQTEENTVTLGPYGGAWLKKNG